MCLNYVSRGTIKASKFNLSESTLTKIMVVQIRFASSQTTAIERPMAAAQLAMPTQQWRWPARKKIQQKLRSKTIIL